MATATNAQKQERSRRVTLRDVAKQSGFSISTVSIVLNDAPLARYIPDETKTRIRNAAKKLGYHPNLFARSLRSNRTRTVGVLVFDMGDPYCTPIIQGIEDALYRQAYLPIVTDVQNERERFENYLGMLLGMRIDGLIVLGNWLFMEVDVLAELAKNHVPTVIIGHEMANEPVSSLLVDNESGARLAIEHLYNLGHRDIAFFRGPKGLGDVEPRWRGVESFAREHGINIRPELVVELPVTQHPTSGFEPSVELTHRLLARGLPFSAILAFDDISALGAMRALASRGVDVPFRCSVVGFDDIAAASLCTPALTTVRQPLATMGEMAVTMTLESIKSQRHDKAVQVLRRRLPAELVVRASTAPVQRVSS